MNSSLFPFSPSVSVFVFLLLVFIEIPSSLSNDDLYTQCRAQFVCGNINASFPFWGKSRPSSCGRPELQLWCENNNITKIKINDVGYQVLDINQDSEILKIAREDYLVGICPHQLVNTTFDPLVFELGTGYSAITIFYGCPAILPPLSAVEFNCRINGTINQGGYVLPLPGDKFPLGCYGSVGVPVVPVPETALGAIMYLTHLLANLKLGFEVKWKAECGECLSSRGACGFDNTSKQTTCYCPNQSKGSKTCVLPAPAPAEKSSTQKKLGIALGLAGAGIIVMFVGFWILVCLRRKKRKAALVQNKDQPKDPSSKGLPTSTTVSQSIPSYASSNSGLQKSGSTYFGVRVFTYEELEKATNYFDSSKELGEGGFGTVYHGVLGDGRVVAVKRLFENNMRRAEQFMNEIEILALLQHKNLVKLYGCTSRHSRELLLVYEYVPNGTVADHLHGRQSNSGLLPLPVRLSIAIETASALAYLHASDVIHRDVKSNNILLDNAFHVKVADFGLSRLFPTDVTHVSTAPQGTPGYVDPEYYQCYQLTNKSDVYSFGVVLMELVSALEAVDTSRHRHDINLANMAVNKIQSHALHELVDPSLGFEKDLVVRRTVTSVSELAFRCLQQEREMRPTMDEVLEMLRRIEKENYGEGKAEVLDIRDDDVGLLKCAPPPLQLSPDSVTDTLWISGSSTATPHSY